MIVRSVPEPHVLDRQVITGEVRGGELLLGGEDLLLDIIETVSQPRELDVLRDVGPLHHALVGHDLEAMDELGIQRKPHRPAREGQPAQQQRRSPGPACGEEQQGQGCEQTEDDQAVQDRQGGVDIGIDRAEDDAPPGKEQFVRVELIPPGLHAEQHRKQNSQVNAGRLLHVEDPWADHDPMREKIEHARSDRGEEQKAQEPLLQVRQERQSENIEA